MKHCVVDLRSDTVTQPTAVMRRAMAEAEVGDDLFREDPTVRRLEARAAEILGLEAALFVPSGTMGNQIALHVLSRETSGPGGEVICEAGCHLIHYEVGAMAAISGLLPKPLTTVDGRLSAAAVAAAVAPEADYRSRSALVAVENTHNMAGGKVYDRGSLDRLLEVARAAELPTHLDGARLFNAAAALGVAPAVLTAGFDTVMVCLTKGLGAPVGSVLAAGRERIEEARRVRKMLGGAMRQVGVVAAAGLVALEEGPRLLAGDHLRARDLAAGLAEIEGLTVDPEAVETNILLVRVEAPLGSAERLARALASPPVTGGGNPVLVLAVAPDTLRLVTHRDVDDDAIKGALKSFGTLARTR